MHTSFIENTDRFALIEFTSEGKLIGYGFFDKRKDLSVLVKGPEFAENFRKKYKEALLAWCTEGSVYYTISKNQVLYALFADCFETPDSMKGYQSHRHQAPHDYYLAMQDVALQSLDELEAEAANALREERAQRQSLNQLDPL